MRTLFLGATALATGSRVFFLPGAQAALVALSSHRMLTPLTSSPTCDARSGWQRRIWGRCQKSFNRPIIANKKATPQTQESFFSLPSLPPPRVLSRYVPLAPQINPPNPP